MSLSETAELMQNLRLLSEVDGHLAGLTEKKAVLELEMCAIREDVEARNSCIEERLKKVKETAYAQHKNESSLKEAEKELLKVRAQLNSARTNEELKIFMRKREELEARISELEDAILAQLAGAEEAGKEVEAARDVLRAKEAQASLRLSELRDEIAKCQQEHDVTCGRRRETASRLPSQVLEKYERVLRREKRRPVVEVRDNTCQGCFMKVTLQQVNLLLRGEDLVLCKNCNRILCLPVEEV